jgi:hypothetical protein
VVSRARLTVTFVRTYADLEHFSSRHQKDNRKELSKVRVCEKLIPMAERSKARFCGRMLAGIVGSDPPRAHGCISVVSVVCCQVEVSATSRSFV